MTSIWPRVRGVIFDLDGTLVDSGLDFAQMRREMGLAEGAPVLEAIEQLPEPRATECRGILDRHEWAGVAQARAMPGAHAVIDTLQQLRIPLAILTRNRRTLAEATLARCRLEIALVIGREDAPAKPDPTAIVRLCQQWQLAPAEVAIVGDYRFDLEAGRRAGARTVLYTAGADVSQLAWSSLADVQLACFTQPAPLLQLLAERDD